MRSGFFFLLICIVLTSFFSLKETKTYPTDYFRAPVDYNMMLSGTFGELRPNHFHAGIDIKPIKGIGDKLYNIGDGYISRIKVSHKSYGNCLYIDHPNGYTSVYAHLYKFPPEIAKFVKEKQYEQQAFYLDVYPDSSQFKLPKGALIGYLGTSGRSFGPHLHFEIRETKTEVPINPLLFGLKVKDGVAPMINELKVYFLSSNMQELGTKKYTPAKGTKNYYIKGDTIYAPTNQVGFGLKTYDLFAGVRNWNGVYGVTMLVDGAPWFEFVMDEISFDETRYINAHIDYPEHKKHKSYFNRCFTLPGNNLSIYTVKEQNGLVPIFSDRSRKIEFISTDIEGNKSKLGFYIRQKEDADMDVPHKHFNYVVPYNSSSIIDQGEGQIFFEENNFYETLYLDYKISPETSADIFSSVHHLENAHTPVHKPFRMAIRPTNLPEHLWDKAHIVRCKKNNETTSIGGEWQNGYLSATSKELGEYCIMVDTLPPSLVNQNLKSNMRGVPRINFKVEDKDSGFETNFNGYIDNQWVLMEYDQKNKLLFHRFDDRTTPGQHEFKLSVVDNRGNERIFTKTFSR